MCLKAEKNEVWLLAGMGCCLEKQRWEEERAVRLRCLQPLVMSLLCTQEEGIFAVLAAGVEEVAVLECSHYLHPCSSVPGSNWLRYPKAGTPALVDGSPLPTGAPPAAWYWRTASCLAWGSDSGQQPPEVLSSAFKTH